MVEKQMPDVRTCASCQHIGGAYWGDSWRRIHYCAKSQERRRDAFRPSGDFADDFMREFRTFYDATAGQKACQFYEEREPISGDALALLTTIAECGREGAVFKFFSPENSAAYKMSGKFIEGGEHAYPQEPARGERRYRITDVGKAELARTQSLPNTHESGGRE
jgi:hypothetical protein